MTHTPLNIHINEQRFKTNFEALSRIGATDAGGAQRSALSVADLEARAWLRERIKAAGLEYACDAAGNQSAVLRGNREGAPHFLLSSHLDTVPNGGRFDGALGVRNEEMVHIPALTKPTLAAKMTVRFEKRLPSGGAFFCPEVY